jgi:hypothetical protein
MHWVSGRREADRTWHMGEEAAPHHLLVIGALVPDFDSAVANHYLLPEQRHAGMHHNWIDAK